MFEGGGGIKHNHCHHYSFDILCGIVLYIICFKSIHCYATGIRYWYCMRPILLDIGCLTLYCSNSSQYGKKVFYWAHWL